MPSTFYKLYYILTTNNWKLFSQNNFFPLWFRVGSFVVRASVIPKITSQWRRCSVVIDAVRSNIWRTVCVCLGTRYVCVHVCMCTRLDFVFFPSFLHRCQISICSAVGPITGWASPIGCLHTHRLDTYTEKIYKLNIMDIIISK
jgi:hypothetical protein